jgi:4-hydroxybenzoate polyprenyltransferase
MGKSLKTMFISPSGTLSSKRTIGSLMIFFASFLLVYVLLNNITLDSNVTGLIRDMIYGGAALVGSTIFEKKFKKYDTK